MDKCRIIALEGIDGSGKTIQSELLKNKLSSIGKSCLEISFPNYDSFIGKEIGYFLSGKSKVTATDIDCKSMALWFALDRHLHLSKIDFYKYDFLILNRYTLSNAVYQGARVRDSSPIEFAKWVFELEFTELNLPRPDLYFVLNITREVSKTNISKKGFRDYIGDKADIYESSNEIINSTKELYIKFAREFDNITLINCMENNKILSPEIIQENIFSYVKKLFDYTY